MFVQQADSESELRLADSLASAGSSSTLASSVIEVEAERPEGSFNQQLKTAENRTVFQFQREKSQGRARCLRV